MGMRAVSFAPMPAISHIATQGGMPDDAGGIA